MVKNKKALIILIAILAVLPLINQSKPVHNAIILLLIFASLGEAWNLITGFAGQTSFGHAAFFGIGAYTSAVIFSRYGITPWAGVILGGILASAAAAVISYPCFRLKGHYFAIATLAAAEIVKQIFVSWKYVEGATGISLPIIARSSGFGKRLFYLQFNDKLPWVYICLVMFAAVIFFCSYLENSKMGYYLKAIRESHEVAESIGINTTNYKLYVMVISAFISAVCGSIYAQYILYIDPFMIFSLDISMKIVLLTVLGGVGNIFGPIIGAAVFILLSEFTRIQLGGSGTGIDLMIYGLLIVLITCFQPKGVIGIIARVSNRLKQQKRGGEGNAEAAS
ncbi:MAG: branched-chain amino acid ABC transporter permease [Clostridia bacterium]|nr:branched-chain amino acid ABC transporter permease [Clostridia bacterium]